MSDASLREDLQRIAALERKVSDLYERIGQAEPIADPADADSDEKLIALVQEGQKLLAVKRYVELTGAGLGEASDAVDRLAEMYRPAG